MGRVPGSTIGQSKKIVDDISLDSVLSIGAGPSAVIQVSKNTIPTALEVEMTLFTAGSDDFRPNHVHVDLQALFH